MPRPRYEKTRLPFDLPPKTGAEKPELAKLRNPERLWTGNKARLIQRYLVSFIQVTRHGTYVDGFAGPQYPTKPGSWAARLVLRDDGPQMLRHFYLFELEDPKVRMLEELAAGVRDRDVRIFPGDFNVRVDEILRPDVIGPREATFCLLDQRTFECKWSTVQRLAEFKRDQPYKIELFYFLAQAWLDRALRTRTRLISLEEVRDWWGRDDFDVLRDMRGSDRARLMSRRFQEELGYKFAAHYEIYQTRGGRRVMYYMIHATDHSAAPRLMGSAYDDVVRAPVRLDQLPLPLG